MTPAPFFLFMLASARVARGLALLVAILYGGMALANVMSLSHDPFAQLAHDAAGEMTFDVASSHGHTHDDDAPEAAAQPHGHHAADHSHDKQDLAPVMTVLGGRVAHALQPNALESPSPEPVFVFERPPRSLPIS